MITAILLICLWNLGVNIVMLVTLAKLYFEVTDMTQDNHNPED